MLEMNVHFANKATSSLLTALVTAPNFSEWGAARLGKTDESTSLIMRWAGAVICFRYFGGKWNEAWVICDAGHEIYQNMQNWVLLMWWLLRVCDKLISCFCCDVKGFSRFPVTVQRKAHKGWTSIKGGQIHSTIITIHSFLWGHAWLPDGTLRRLSEHQGTSIKCMRSGETERGEKKKKKSHAAT